MNELFRQTLRWTLVIAIIVQPILCVWMVIIIMRVKRDQATIQQFVDVWSKRIAAQTNVNEVISSAEILVLLKAINDKLTTYGNLK